jgi:hypothetical protein
MKLCKNTVLYLILRLGGSYCAYLDTMDSKDVGMELERLSY